MSDCPRCGRTDTHACPPTPPLTEQIEDAYAEKDAALAALAELRTVAEGLATYLRECLGCNACKGCVEEECGIHEVLAALAAWKKAQEERG